MKSISAKKLTSLAATILLLFVLQSGIVYAQNDNTPNGTTINKLTGEPIKGFGDYMRIVFDFGIAITGILSMTMIVIGGYQYMVSMGNAETAAQAKARITSALVGLIIALLSFLILQTFNPDLLSFKVDPVPAVDLEGGNNNERKNTPPPDSGVGGECDTMADCPAGFLCCGVDQNRNLVPCRKGISKEGCLCFSRSLVDWKCRPREE